MACYKRVFQKGITGLRLEVLIMLRLEHKRYGLGDRHTDMFPVNYINYHMFDAVDRKEIKGIGDRYPFYLKKKRVPFNTLVVMTNQAPLTLNVLLFIV